MHNSYIKGIGHFLPEKVVTNNDLSKLINTNDDWIRNRTGISKRHFAEEGQGPSDLAIPAVEMALQLAEIKKTDIGLIIFATSTPDYYVPGSACILQQKMDLMNIGALDIRVQCSGFIYGLSIADQYIKTGQFNNVLVVGSEVQSTALDISDRGRDTAVIFADGAGAAIVSATDENKGLLSTHIHSDGNYAKELWIESPSSTSNPRLNARILEEGRQFLYMNGREVFRHAVEKFPNVILKAIRNNNLEMDEIDYLIPHQANIRIIDFISKKLNFPMEKIITNIDRVGNTTAASVPIALSEAVQDGRIKEGMNLILAAFGSGFTWGSAAIKW